jgi:hypothetical protein
MKHRRRKHGRKSHTPRHSYRASNPLRKHHRKHRRHGRRRVSNPLLSTQGLTAQILPALIGGAGAIGVDVGLAYASPYLPAFLQSGWGRIGAQVLGAVGLGLGAGKFIDRETGKAVLAGALTITAYSALRQVLAPTLGNSVKGLSGLADFSDYSPATNWSGGAAIGAGMGRVGAYMRQGAYMPQGRLGYANPGTFLQKQLAAYMPAGAYGSYDSESM